MARNTGFFEGKAGRKRLIAIVVAASVVAAGLAVFIIVGLPAAPPSEDVAAEVVIETPSSPRSPSTPGTSDTPSTAATPATPQGSINTDWLSRVDHPERLDMFTTREISDLGAALDAALKERGESAASNVSVPLEGKSSGARRAVWLVVNGVAWECRVSDNGAWDVFLLDHHVDGIDDALVTWSKGADPEVVALEQADTAAKPTTPAASTEAEGSQKQDTSGQSSGGSGSGSGSSQQQSSSEAQKRLVENPSVPITQAPADLPEQMRAGIVEALKAWDSKGSWESARLETDSIGTEGSWIGVVVDSGQTGSPRFTQVWWDSATNAWSMFDFTV